MKQIGAEIEAFIEESQASAVIESAIEETKVSPAGAKNRQKYLLSLGLVPKGQEKQLEFIKRPSPEVASKIGTKDLEAKLKEVNEWKAAPI